MPEEKDKIEEEPEDLTKMDIPQTDFLESIKLENTLYNPIIIGATIRGGKAVIGSGDNVLKFTEDEGLWLGNANFDDAPFKVDMEGATKANSLERNDLHWFTLFESIDGYGTTTEGTGSITLSQGYISLKTGDGLNEVTELQKFQTNPQAQFTWDKDRKFKILVKFVTDTACETRIACGDGSTETGRKLGFLIMNDAIYGEVANGTTHEVTSSTSFSANDYKLLEIKYISGTSASFYVNGSLLGTLSTYLPSGTTIAGNLLDVHMQVKENAVVKEMWVHYFDFWQAN